MKIGSHHTKQAKDKIKLARKRQGSNVWNKGLKYAKYDEPSHTRFRRDKNYYLKELEINAKRAKRLGYHDTPKRRKEIDKLIKEKQLKTGAGRSPKDWSNEEIRYLRENYLDKDILTIALYLKRSYSSVSHKVNRIGLEKYHKWN
jgi:hypothetical protein